MAFGVHHPSRIAASASSREDGAMRFWYTKWVTLGNQRGFTLAELMLATVIIGPLSTVPLLAVAVSPRTAGAAQAPVMVTGLIWGIDQGDVKPAGKESLQKVQVAPGVTIPLVISASGRYVVLERHVTGVVTSGPGTGAPFTLTYHANVPLLTQSGQVHAFVVGSGFEIGTHFTSQIGGPCTSLLDPIIGFLGVVAGVPPSPICGRSLF